MGKVQTDTVKKFSTSVKLFLSLKLDLIAVSLLKCLVIYVRNLKKGHVNQTFCFVSWSAGVSTFELAAAVTSPSGVTEAAVVSEVEDGYGVQFVPKELGVHTVSVKLHDIHIPGLLVFHVPC